jgi:hypothetical protein
MTKTRTFLENIVILAIVLVLLQTFLEDLAILLSWNVGIRTVLLVAGFFFDVFFTVEFVVRSYDAWRQHRFRHYFFHERGWIDLAASIPLLLLNSGPRLLALLAGGLPIGGVGGMLNVLKVVKAIRIARVLRLLRVLKLFTRIKNTDSEMAQRHVAVVSASSVSTFVFTLLILAVAGMFVTAPSLETEYRVGAQDALEYIMAEGLVFSGEERALENYMASRPDILALESAGSVRFSRYDRDYYGAQFSPQDYTVIRQDGLRLFVDLRPINRDNAATNLQYFAVIVALVLVFMFFYSPHFALTVTDPIHVMRRGMSEQNYSLEVVIPDAYSRDDIYRLAAEYNRVYLPMKDRDNLSGEGEQGTTLSLDNMDDLFS